MMQSEERISICFAISSSSFDLASLLLNLKSHSGFDLHIFSLLSGKLDFPLFVLRKTHRDQCVKLWLEFGFYCNLQISYSKFQAHTVVQVFSSKNSRSYERIRIHGSLSSSSEEDSTRSPSVCRTSWRLQMPGKLGGSKSQYLLTIY